MRLLYLSLTKLKFNSTALFVLVKPLTNLKNRMTRQINLNTSFANNYQNQINEFSSSNLFAFQKNHLGKRKMAMEQSQSHLETLGETYRMQWTKLVNAPVDVKNKNSFIVFQKRRLNIDECDEIEELLMNEFIKYTNNVFHLHLSL